MRAAVVLAMLLGAQAAPGAAQGARRGPALNWVRLSGAESCIAPVELGERVEQRLGRAVLVRIPDAIVVIEGQVAPTPTGGFAALIRVSDPSGDVYGAREIALEDGDCRRLDEMVALVVAVTIRNRGGSGIPLPPEIAASLDALFEGEPAQLDPAELAAAPAAPAPAAAEPAEPVDTPAVDPAAVMAAERGSAWQLGAGAGWLAATGLQPDPTLGPALHVRLGLERVGSAVLSASFGLVQRRTVRDPDFDPDGVLRLQPLQAALALCGPDWTALGFALCGHAAVSVLQAEASGFAVEDGESSAAFVELGPEASLRAQLSSPVYLRLAVRVPVRLSRPEFAYTRRDATPGEAFRAARVGIAGELGLGVELF